MATGSGEKRCGGCNMVFPEMALTKRGLCRACSAKHHAPTGMRAVVMNFIRNRDKIRTCVCGRQIKAIDGWLPTALDVCMSCHNKRRGQRRAGAA